MQCFLFCERCWGRPAITRAPDITSDKPVDKKAIEEAPVPVNVLENHGAKDDASIKHAEVSTATLDEEMIRFLSGVPLFQCLPKEFYPQLVSGFETVEYQPGDIIIRQGEPGHDFFILRDGSVNVDVSGSIVATKSAGDFFGEMALLRNESRTATITAVTKILAFRITRSQFQELELNEKLVFSHRKAVAGGARHIEVKPPSPKAPEEVKLMTAAFKSNRNLSLANEHIMSLISIAWKEEVPSGEEVIREGDENADYFYIVQSGRFEVFVSQKDKNGLTPVCVATVEAGGSFGELALLYFAPRAATVKAVTKSSVWVVDCMSFKSIIEKSAEDAAKANVRYLNLNIFSSLQQDEKEMVAKALTEVTFTKGETIFKEGEQADRLYILLEGEVTFEKDQRVKRLRGDAQKAPAFGEQALLKNEAQPSTAKVKSERALCLTLDKVSLELILGPMGESGPQPSAARSASVGTESWSLQMSSAVNASRGKIRRKDLRTIGLLGCGGFGKVELVEHSTTGESFALKGMSKGYIVKVGMQKSVINEKNVQMMCDSPFIVKLYETYNGPQSLFYLLELALGGELYATYIRKGFHGSVKHARYYSAGVVLAFEHMHSKKILYRDLKPENLLLNQDGKIKVTDMGLAKVCVGKTYTTCGTPDYFAPEMLSSGGHTHAVDWWALGVLIFELLVGHPPFESPNQSKTFEKIKKGIGKVSFGPLTGSAEEHLIKSLIRRQPMDRLPLKHGGVSNLKEHPFYKDKDFDWLKMENGTQAVPYKPTVKSKQDLSNFNARANDLPPQKDYKDDKSGWDATFATST